MGCFNVLKMRYGEQINLFIKAYIHHITKVEFFQAFRTAFLATFYKENVFGAFRGAGLIPLDSEAIISKLDIRPRTPTPPTTPSELPDQWVSQTPHNPADAILQSDFIKNRISNHQESSPSSILNAVNQFLKGSHGIAHRLTLMEAEVRELQEANVALGKRRRAKKIRLQDGGSISVSESRRILAEKGIVDEQSGEEGENGGPSKRRRTGGRLCGICRKGGHNMRTCPEAEEIDSNDSSE